MVNRMENKLNNLDGKGRIEFTNKFLNCVFKDTVSYNSSGIDSERYSILRKNGRVVVNPICMKKMAKFSLSGYEEALVRITEKLRVGLESFLGGKYDF